MADEVFSGGVSVTGVEPGTTTIAIKSTTNPNISKKVPVTVKSRNLLAYGPASGNGLTVTVAQDGSLDFSSGTESVPLNKGVRVVRALAHVQADPHVDVVRGHHRSSRHEGFPVAAGSEESGRPRRTHITTRPAPCAPEASV